MWKIDAEISVQQTPAMGAWVCTIVDGGSYQAGTPLGVHSVNASGTPTCTVSAGMIVQNNLGTVSMPLSHEIMEMLVDPYLSSVTFSQASDPNSATVYLREICDPVASYGYQIDGVTVSDFTYPVFWRAGFPPPRKSTRQVVHRRHDPCAHGPQLHDGALYFHVRRDQLPRHLELYLGQFLRARPLLTHGEVVCSRLSRAKSAPRAPRLLVLDHGIRPDRHRAGQHKRIARRASFPARRSRRTDWRCGAPRCAIP